MFHTKFVEKIKKKTYPVFSNFSENCAACEIMYKNVKQPDRPQITTEYAADALNAG